MGMSAGALISVDEYLRTSYQPDREYRDGVVTERNAGDKTRSKLVTVLMYHLAVRDKQEYRGLS